MSRPRQSTFFPLTVPRRRTKSIEIDWSTGPICAGEWEIPMKLESLNKTYWASWHKAHAQKKRWSRAMSLIVRRPSQDCACPMDVEITVHRNRMLDYDNMVGGCKPIFDVLKTIGRIVDDSPSWIIKRRYVQQQCPRGEEKVCIRLLPAMLIAPVEDIE